MSSYRFCRTDDIPLLVDALNRCWGPYVPDEPAMTVADFKRDIRNLQIWCSSCMVAFAGAEPIGVLVGAKRTGTTLVYRIAVHPDHRRQGHGRHLLTSLGSKLAILGPPSIVAEIPRPAAAVHDLFVACGFTPVASYTDFVLDGAVTRRPPEALPERIVIPVTVDDLVANGLLGDGEPHACWQRSHETLTARKDEIAGAAIASDERIEAYVLHAGDEILALRSDVADPDAVRLRLLLGRTIALARGPLRIAKVHPDEIPAPLLEDLGFRRTRVHERYAGKAGGA